MPNAVENESIAAVLGSRILVFPAIIIVVTLAGYFAYRFMNSEPSLTDKDFVLVVDFENRTEEPVLDAALAQAITIVLH